MGLHAYFLYWLRERLWNDAEFVSFREKLWNDAEFNWSHILRNVQFTKCCYCGLF
jgi:hypothetical protein